MVANFNTFGISTSLILIILFLIIVITFFNTIFSLPFIGFIFSLVSYFVYDYRFASVPVIATLGFIFSFLGFTEKGDDLMKKLFSIFGILISGYILLINYGIL